MRLALDWGRARIGVAACDPDGTMAHPVETIAAGPGALARVQALLDEYEPVEVVLGWPRNLRGEDGPAAQAMAEVHAALSEAVAPVPVCVVDERMSSAEAARRLVAAGKNSRQRRGIIDQAAAVGILEQALEERRHRAPRKVEQ